MTGTLCQSAALGRSIAPLVEMIAALFGVMIRTILSLPEKLGNNVQEPDFHCRESRVAGTVSPDIARIVPPVSGGAVADRRNRKGRSRNLPVRAWIAGERSWVWKNLKAKPERQNQKGKGITIMPPRKGILSAT